MDSYTSGMSFAQALFGLAIIFIWLFVAVAVAIIGFGCTALAWQRKFPVYGVVPYWLLVLAIIVVSLIETTFTGILSFCFFAPIPGIILWVAFILERRKRRVQLDLNKQTA